MSVDRRAEVLFVKEATLFYVAPTRLCTRVALLI